MPNNASNNNQIIQIFLRWIMGLAAAATIGALLWYFREVVVYILVSALFAITGRPLVSVLCKVTIKSWSMPRWLAATLTLALLWIVIGGLIALVVPLVAGKVYELASLDLRSALEGVQAPLERMQNYISTIFVLPESHVSISDVLVSTLRRFLNYDTVNAVVTSIINMGMSVVVVVFSVSFITFFFLKEDGLFSTMVSSIFPDKYAENVHRAIEKVSLLLSRYFMGLLTESLIIATVITVVLLFFGMKVEDACFIAVIMGILNVIPYAGPAVGVLVSIFIGIVSPIEGCTIAYTLAVICSTICVVKGVDDFVLQPTIYSSKVSAHPLEIFIVILMAGSVGGIVGLLVAVPSYTVLRVFAKEFFSEVSLVRKLTKEISRMLVVEGVVVGGNRLGRKLGFPTANIAIDDTLTIENGVYCSKVVVDGETYDAMTNIGVRPSVDGSRRLLETHLFGFKGLLYGLKLRVELYDKIRDEKRFSSVEELREQIAKDAEVVKANF